MTHHALNHLIFMFLRDGWRSTDSCCLPKPLLPPQRSLHGAADAVEVVFAVRFEESESFLFRLKHLGGKIRLLIPERPVVIWSFGIIFALFIFSFSLIIFILLEAVCLTQFYEWMDEMKSKLFSLVFLHFLHQFKEFKRSAIGWPPTVSVRLWTSGVSVHKSPISAVWCFKAARCIRNPPAARIQVSNIQTGTHLQRLPLPVGIDGPTSTCPTELWCKSCLFLLCSLVPINSFSCGVNFLKPMQIFLKISFFPFLKLFRKVSIVKKKTFIHFKKLNLWVWWGSWCPADFSRT